MMNLTTLHSGSFVFSNVEYINGFAYKTAFAREKSAFFQINLIIHAVLCSSFTSEGTVV